VPLSLSGLNLPSTAVTGNGPFWGFIPGNPAEPEPDFLTESDTTLTAASHNFGKACADANH
jgi:hypothetical protein